MDTTLLKSIHLSGCRGWQSLRKKKKKGIKYKHKTKKAPIRDISTELTNIDSWAKILVTDSQYTYFEPHINVAAFKINDIYMTISHARTSLIYIYQENYGQLIRKKDVSHLAFIRSLMLQSALFYYNCIIDFSWQAVWLFCQKSDCKLYNKGYFENLLKKEDIQNEVVEFLNYLCHIDKCNSFKYTEILRNLRLFSNYALNETKIRGKYNYLKHRGAFYLPGLGENPKTTFESVKVTLKVGEGLSGSGIGYMNFDEKGPFKKIPALYRDEIDVNEWANILIAFDSLYVRCFSEIIDVIIPDSYIDLEKIDINDYINKCHNYYIFENQLNQ